MKLTMMGTGYVGLTSGVCFSDFGHEVVCYDPNPEIIAELNSGNIPIYEPGLDAVMVRNIETGRLKFTDNLSEAMTDVDAVFITVGTPTLKGDGHADLKYVRDAAKEIAAKLSGYTTIITKSTVPVGTNREVEKLISQVNPDADFDVVSNPEFLREGSAVHDFMVPDRIVIGAKTEKAKAVMTDIYKPLFLRDFPIVFTNFESAELIKYASNAFLATKITFINEIAGLCEKVGAEVEDVSRGMGLDNRIGDKFLHAGPGYGGSCFPKDTRALARTGQDYSEPMEITETVIRVNEDRKRKMIEKITDVCGGTVNGKTVAVLGVTFKENTDDLREAPSLTIVPSLVGSGAKVRVSDPLAESKGSRILPGVEWCVDAYQAAADADALIILTGWNQFKALDLTRLALAMKTPRMVDLRNLYSAERVIPAGFEIYSGIGSKTVNKLA